MPLLLYRIFYWLFFPLIFAVLVVRILRGKEDRALFHERLGRPDIPRPAGQLVWVHGASVGEVVSHLPVVSKLRMARPDVNILLTTGTFTGRRMLERRKEQLIAMGGSGQIILQYVPLDIAKAVHRFFAHWKPDVSVFVESEFWPELVMQAPNAVLLNGRMSDRSWPKYKRYKWFFKPMLSRFTTVLAQSETDKQRLSAIGAPHVQVGGNLKFDAEPLPVDEEAVEKFRTALQGRPVIVAASTHQGEEEQVAAIHQQLVAKVPELLTVIVPRHPHRGTQAANAALRFTKAVRRRGIGEMPTLGGPRHTEIYIADTLGELGLWYRLASAVIMGGSLQKVGGHNPLEPLKLAIPTVCGPYMFNFMDMMPQLTEKGLLVQKKSDTEIANHLLQWLTDNTARDAHIATLEKGIPAFGGSTSLACAVILARL
jgi:3-deoxy-D-manno-octulosonic-acid transferase